MSTPAPATTEVDAIQAALAGEHACVYGYGVVGSHLSGDAQATARRALGAHEDRRAELREHLLAMGAVPEAAEPAYSLPFPVTDAASARELAGLLEQRLAAPYADLVGAATDTTLRGLAAEALRAAAMRAVRWGVDPTPLPGLDDRIEPHPPPPSP
ncbi:ferritin-like domain-containing protein [Phytoactinopolyspora limicola]|uniref:ferritin-like domain-containing protein n=1 Tax=Phytoactinopolyspora limicola TaxID=2715536 RepID=UPI001409791F|nr:ferritin-like domain-containing protein [Phytoactinopolyspora limicola]